MENVAWDGRHNKKDLLPMRFAIGSIYNYRQKQRRTGRICGRKAAEQGRTPVEKGRKSQKSRRTEPIRADFWRKPRLNRWNCAVNTYNIVGE